MSEMPESIIAILSFWIAFYFSPGPWWFAFMDTAKNASTRWLVRNLGVCIIVGWLPFVAISSAIARVLGGIHSAILLALYFIGGGYMLYLAYKTVTAAKQSAATEPNFNWKAMIILDWSNPKAWLTIPAASLASTYADSAAANIAIFAMASVPVLLIAAVFWTVVARQGAKIAGDKRMGFANGNSRSMQQPAEKRVLAGGIRHIFNSARSPIGGGEVDSGFRRNEMFFFGCSAELQFGAKCVKNVRGYLPMQKREKISPSSFSSSVPPVKDAIYSCAEDSHAAAISACVPAFCASARQRKLSSRAAR